jgi:hypothetical protein
MEVMSLIQIVNKILGWMFIVGIIGLFITGIDYIWLKWNVDKLLFSSLVCIIGSVLVSFLLNIEPEEK